MASTYGVEQGFGQYSPIPEEDLAVDLDLLEATSQDTMTMDENGYVHLSERDTIYQSPKDKAA